MHDRLRQRIEDELAEMEALGRELDEAFGAVETSVTTLREDLEVEDE